MANAQDKSTFKPAPAGLRELMARLLRNTNEGTPQRGEQVEIPVSHYTSEQRRDLENEVLFRKYPLILGHVSELPENNMCLRNEATGLPIVLTRDGSGTIRAFLNVCRHRGMRLQEEQGPCKRKTLVCPYHGWTYQLSGELKHLPHADGFPKLQADDAGLVELPCAIQNGLIFVLPTPGEQFDGADWLAELSDDFSHLGLEDSVVYRKVEVVRDANWKLIIDAFLEAYHVKILHRNSVYPFFLDAVAESDVLDWHIRSIVARRKLEEASVDDPSQWDFREHVSVTHFVFPNCIFVHHPDYSSMITVYPESANKLRWVHHMLIPRERHTEAERAHWEKTFHLIEETVFQAEDLHAAQGIQAGLHSAANSVMTLGEMEYLVWEFHQRIERALGG